MCSSDLGEHWYCSTAGRILLNASVPGCLTSASFTDSWGIAKAVMGEGVDLSKFRELKYDMPWVTTKERPKGREKAVKLGDIQLEVYEIYGERQSIITTQKLFEIGVSFRASAGPKRRFWCWPSWKQTA